MAIQLTTKTLAELEDLSVNLRVRVRDLIVACPYRVGITSAWRSYAEQNYLYRGWVRRLPGFNPANPPGMSRHEDMTPTGAPAANAADLNYYGNQDAVDWCQANAGMFGLHFPIRRENWHIEPNGRPYNPTPATPVAEEIEEDIMTYLFRKGNAYYLRDNGATIHVPSMSDVTKMKAIGTPDAGVLSDTFADRLIAAGKYT